VTASGGTLSALVGLLTLRLTLGGVFQRYVRSGMKTWLIIAGVALLALGLITLVRALRAEQEPEHEPVGDGRWPDGHPPSRHRPNGHAPDGRERPVGAGWLLLVPVAVLLLVAPPGLGSFGVDRAAPVRITSGTGALPPLEPSLGPIPMTLLEYTQRSFDGGGASLKGATVALTGFVAAGAAPSGFRLARYQIACCAADAAAAVVRIVDVSGGAPTRDQWLTVTGTFKPGAGDDPVLSATSIQQIAAPEDPYE